MKERKEMYQIRKERENERFEVENLVRESFWNVYRPGCLEHYLLHELRKNADFIPELNFVMEEDGKLIGQVVCVKATIRLDDGADLPIMTLGPISIHPDCQKKGYGKILLDYTLEQAQKLGYRAVCFEGDIAFYGKSGFTYASDFGIRYHGLPEGMQADFFLAKELERGYFDGATGEYATPQAYLIDEEEAEAYDKLFPPKRKEKKEGQ